MTANPKIAGCMPFACAPDKLEWMEQAISELFEICDMVFLLDDGFSQNSGTILMDKFPNVKTWINLRHREKCLWSDFAYHSMLMMEAARNGCEWIVWLDHDERFWPHCSRDIIRNLITDAHRNPTMVGVSLPWLTLYDNEDQVRVDGVFSHLHKTFLQRNPFLSTMICFQANALLRLHHWPVQNGAQLYRQDIGVLHYGYMNKSSRMEKLKKYSAEDEGNPMRELYKKTVEQMDEGALFKPLTEVKLTDYSF